MKKEIIEKYIKEIPYKKLTELIEEYFYYNSRKDNLNEYELEYLDELEKELLKRNKEV